MDTFVIRLWTPAGAAPARDDDPRGVAHHVGTGRTATFRDAAELLVLLRDLGRRDEGSPEPRPDATRIDPGF